MRRRRGWRFRVGTALTALVVAVAVSGSPSTGWAQERGGGPPGRAGGPPGPPPEPTITQVAGDVYKVETGPGVSDVIAFLVTPEGVFLANTSEPRVSAWLRDALAERFGVPVRYVAYTHYHWDHTRGGGLFADTATFLAHEQTAVLLEQSIAEAPPPGTSRDLNGDGLLDREEATGGTRNAFDALDGNGDGLLSQREITADIRRPDITFSDRYTVELGGKTVELIHTGPRHTVDMTDIYFPDDGVVYAGDYLWLGRVCCGFAFDGVPLDDWIASVREVEALDFDVIVNSHFRQGTKADVTEFREYLEALRDAVAAGIAAGQSLEELQASITLDQYSDWEGYGNLSNVIASAYQNLTQ